VSLVVDEHREYLSDPVRLQAFRDAIREVVAAGDVVVDLGCGTGVLGMFACEAGARRVYAIEQGGMIEVARSLARANGLADRITFVPGFSKDVTLPEPADVVIADQVGHFGFEAGVLEYFADARRRFLRPGGRLVPAAIALVVAPVEAADMFARIEFWSARPAGLDCAPARDWAVNTGYPTVLPSTALLGEPETIHRIDLGTDTARPFDVETTARIARAGVMHGVGGWFSARLSPSVVLTNSPTAARRLTRRNVYLPIDRPVAVGPDDRVAIRIHADPVEVALTWEVRAGGGTFLHSTLRGMLLTREDLRRTRPDFVPALTPRGVARRTVLELCDGTRSLEAIEREVYGRHHELFESPADASVFVAEVVTRYTQ
jgi:protein arginine N-methyltransferase 1